MEKRDDGSGIRCNEHPDAPHGFMRDASHSAGRYVCECESWEPPKREWVGLEDEEIVSLTCECVDDGTFNMNCAHDFARALEARLKEQNERI